MAKYPDAGGVVLEDELAYRWNEDGTWVLRIRLIARILKEDHLTLADQGHPFVEGRSRVRFLHARSILPDGSVVEADLSRVKEIKPQMPPGMFFNATLAMLRIPQAKVGGIIDVAYEVETYNPYRKDFFFPVQYFQSHDPVFHSVLKVDIPESQKLFWETRNFPAGKQEPRVATNAGRTVYSWALHEVGPLVSEPAMPRGADSLPYIQASLFEGWGPVYEWMNGYWRKNTQPSPELASTAREIVAGLTDDDEIIAAIYHWIQKNIRYVIIKGDVATIYGSYPAHETAKKQFGCCVDKALVFSAMLNAVGVDNGPLLINAGSHDLSPRVANLNITHSISRITRKDGTLQYLDSTGYDSRYPSFASVDQGVHVLDPFRESFDLVPLPPPEAHLRQVNATITVNLEGGIDVAMLRNSAGDYEAGARAHFKSMKPQEREQFYTNRINGYGGRGGRLIDLKTFNLDEVSKPYTYSVHYEIPEYAEKVADLFVLGIPGFLEGLELSEAGPQKRNFPIEYDSTYMVSDEGTLTLPDRIAIRSLPEPLHLDTPFFTFRGEYVKVSEREVRYRGEFRLTAKKVPLADYDGFRKAVQQVEHFKKQKIFLVRSTEGGKP